MTRFLGSKAFKSFAAISVAIGLLTFNSTPSQAATKSVRACLVNKAQEPISLLWGSKMYPSRFVILSPASQERDGKGEVVLEPGMRICGQGGTSIAGSMDLTIEVTYANGRKQVFGFYNPLIGRPDFYPNYLGSSVGSYTTFSVDQSKDYDFHFHTFTVTRLKDTSRKEFKVVFTS